MEFVKKTTIRRIQFLCLLALFAFSALAENTLSDCKRMKSSRNSSKSQALRNRRQWLGALVDTVKKALPNGIIKSGVSLLAENLLQDNKEQESHLIKGIASGLGFSLSADFEKCLKQKYHPIKEKINPMMAEYRKFINDLGNIKAHLPGFTEVANFAVDAFNKIAECNTPVQSQKSSLINRLINAGANFFKAEVKKQTNGQVDVALATEMSKHLKVIKDYNSKNTPADREAKGKLLGALIKTIVEKRGRRRRLLKRRRI